MHVRLSSNDSHGFVKKRLKLPRNCLTYHSQEEYETDLGSLYEQHGTFIYEHYESLPQYRYDIIRGIIMRMIKRDNLLQNEAHPHWKFVQEKFPQYWREAIVLHQHELL